MPRALHLDLEEMTEEKLDSLFPRCSPKTPGSSKPLPGHKKKSNRPEVKNMKLSTNQNSPSNSRQNCDLPKPVENREDLMSHSDPYHPVYSNTVQPSSKSRNPGYVLNLQQSGNSSRRQYGYVPDTDSDNREKYSREDEVYQRKIEKAGGLEIISKSRSTRRKRARKVNPSLSPGPSSPCGQDPVPFPGPDSTWRPPGIIQGPHLLDSPVHLENPGLGLAPTQSFSSSPGHSRVLVSPSQEHFPGWAQDHQINISDWRDPAGAWVDQQQLADGSNWQADSQPGPATSWQHAGVQQQPRSGSIVSSRSGYVEPNVDYDLLGSLQPPPSISDREPVSIDELLRHTPEDGLAATSGSQHRGKVAHQPEKDLLLSSPEPDKPVPNSNKVKSSGDLYPRNEDPRSALYPPIIPTSPPSLVASPSLLAGHHSPLVSGLGTNISSLQDLSQVGFSPLRGGLVSPVPGDLVSPVAGGLVSPVPGGLVSPVPRGLVSPVSISPAALSMGSGGSLDNLCLGEEASTENVPVKIEALTLTEYTESPRRFGPRGCSPEGQISPAHQIKPPGGHDTAGHPVVAGQPAIPGQPAVPGKQDNQEVGEDKEEAKTSQLESSRTSNEGDQDMDGSGGGWGVEAGPPLPPRGGGVEGGGQTNLSNQLDSNLSTLGVRKGSRKLPGFPQRVTTTNTTTPPVQLSLNQDIPELEDKSLSKSGESSSVTMTSTLHQAAADLSADHKHVVVRQGQGTGSDPGRQQSGRMNPLHHQDPRISYKHKTDYSYETSETRKVLQEFFKHHDHKDLINQDPPDDSSCQNSTDSGYIGKGATLPTSRSSCPQQIKHSNHQDMTAPRAVSHQELTTSANAMGVPLESAHSQQDVSSERRSSSLRSSSGHHGQHQDSRESGSRSSRSHQDQDSRAGRSHLDQDSRAGRTHQDKESRSSRSHQDLDSRAGRSQQDLDSRSGRSQLHQDQDPRAERSHQDSRAGRSHQDQDSRAGRSTQDQKPEKQYDSILGTPIFGQQSRVVDDGLTVRQVNSMVGQKLAQETDDNILQSRMSGDSCGDLLDLSIPPLETQNTRQPLNAGDTPTHLSSHNSSPPHNNNHHSASSTTKEPTTTVNSTNLNRISFHSLEHLTRNNHADFDQLTLRGDLDNLTLRSELDQLSLRGSGASVGGGGISNYSAPTTTNITTLQTSDMILRSGDISDSLDPGCRDGSMMTSRPRDSLSVAVQQCTPTPRDTLLDVIGPPHRDIRERLPESRNFTLSPETTDCDSADLESELSLPSAGDGSYHSSGPRIHTSMPILEDGLSSGHASDLEEEDSGLQLNHHSGQPLNHSGQPLNYSGQQPIKENNITSALKMKFQSGNSCNNRDGGNIYSWDRPVSRDINAPNNVKNQKSFRPLSTTTNNSCDQPPPSTQQQLSTCQLPQQPILLSSPVYPDKPVCDSSCQPGAEAEVAEQDSDKENRQLTSFSPTASHDTLGSGVDDPGIDPGSRKNPSSHYAAVNGTRNSRDSSVLNGRVRTSNSDHHLQLNGGRQYWNRDQYGGDYNNLQQLASQTPAALQQQLAVNLQQQLNSSQQQQQLSSAEQQLSGYRRRSSTGLESSRISNQDIPVNRISQSLELASRIQSNPDPNRFPEQNLFLNKDGGGDQLVGNHGGEVLVGNGVRQTRVGDANTNNLSSLSASESLQGLCIPGVRESSPPSPGSSSNLAKSSSPPRSAVQAAIKDIRKAIQSTKTLDGAGAGSAAGCQSSHPDPWVPRPRPSSDSGSPVATPPVSGSPPPTSSNIKEESEIDEEEEHEVSEEIPEERVPTPHNIKRDEEELDTDQETDRLLGQQYTDSDSGYYNKNEATKRKSGGKNGEGPVTDPKVLIEGVLFRAKYLGSTQLVCEGQPTKATRMMQAEEAVSRIKAPTGESQPSTEVDLFISTEKIMVLNTDLKEIMMDHGLRTISYIADIGDLVVIMARRRLLPQDGEEPQIIGTTPKMICHVFESEEAQFIAQSIGQAFQVAYMEFLKANGIEDNSFVKEMDYQEVLNSQEIFGDELAMFAKKELQKEVVVPKAKGEILGVVIVESGWGSMLPTIVLANLCPTGPAARCGQLNIGDQVIAINGVSLVGLPLSTCQQYIKNTKNKTAVKLTAVSCPPVVEVKIKRPDTKYQLGFSVQNGVICSLLRGGIAERGGVRVGHRIIEINGQSVVAVPHERIVNLLATSVGEIAMKTMPTSMYRLLTGQETPIYI